MSAMTTALLHRGSRFGDLRLTGYVGSGGFSDVYEAFDKSGRRLAIKVLRLTGLDSEGQQQRIEREREALSRIGSRGVAKLLHSDLQCETPWIASEFVDGPTLQEIVEEGGPLGRDEGLSLIRRLAEILDELHQEGIAHRDLSPNNIIIGPDGPVIIDFGSARIDLEGDATGSLLLAGTSGFVPPEALRGEPVGKAGDIYSLGKIALFSAGLAEESLPVELKSCLSQQSAARPTAQTVAAALDEFQSRVARDSKRKVTRLRRRFRPLTVALLGFCAAAIGIGVGAWLQQQPGPTQSFSPSEREAFLNGQPELPRTVIGSPYVFEVDLPTELTIHRVNPAGLTDLIVEDSFNHLMTLEFFEVRSELPNSLSLSVELLDPFLVPEENFDWDGLQGSPNELRAFFAQFEKDLSTLLSDAFVSCSLTTPGRAEIFEGEQLVVIYAKDECFDSTIHLGLSFSLKDLTLTRVAGLVPKQFSSAVPSLLGASFRTRTFDSTPTRIVNTESDNYLNDLGYGDTFVNFLNSQDELYTRVRSFLLLNPNDALLTKSIDYPTGEGLDFEIRNWAIPIGATINDLEITTGVATSLGAFRGGYGSGSFVIPNRTEFPIIIGLEVGWSSDGKVPLIGTVLYPGVLKAFPRDVNGEIASLFTDGEFTHDFPIVLNSTQGFDVTPYESSGKSVPLSAFTIPLSPRFPSSVVSIGERNFGLHANTSGAAEVIFSLDDYPSIVILEGQVASSTSDNRANEFFDLFPYCRSDGQFSSEFGIRRIDAQVLAGCTSGDIFGKLPSAQDRILRSFPIFRIQIWEQQADGTEQELLRVTFVPEFIDDIDYFAELVASLSEQLRIFAPSSDPIARLVEITRP